MTRLLRTLARLQSNQPLPFLVGALALVLLSLPAIARLAFNSDLVALLPSHVPSVRDLGEITRRFGAPQTLTLLVTSSDPVANRRFVAELAPQLEHSDGSVLSVDWNIREYGAFVRRNLLLFADEAELVEVRDALARQVDGAAARANPFFVDLDGSETPPTLDAVLEKMRARHQVGKREEERLADGYFEHADQRSIAIFLRTSIRGADSAQIDSLRASVAAAVARTNPARYAPDLHVEYGGGVMDMYTEKSALEDAALVATLLTLGLVALSIVVFFLRWRSVPILLLGLGPPICLTFAFAHFAVEYLNASSAFLSAIVIGNGINPHIIWLARYLEARRGGKRPGEAVEEAHVGTWPGTLSASLAAAVAYASLVLTDFRAFRDFGLIGGVGMSLCWVFTFLWTPVVALLFERLRPITPGRVDGNFFGRLVERVALGRPRRVVAVALVMSAASLALSVRWVVRNPIEYDFRNLQSQHYDSPLQQVNRRIAAIVDETTNGSAIAVLVRARGDVPHVVRQLEEARARDPSALGAVRTVLDLLPKDQERKLPLVAEIRALMLRARPHLGPKDVAELDRYLPAADLRVVSEADLPETVARPFIEKNGQRGSIIYVEHNLSQNQFDGRYLMRWAEVARSPRNLDGTPVAAAGAAPVVADLVEAILHDGPKAVAASFGATLLLLFFTFLRARDRFFTFGALLVGALWMVAGMALGGMKINFLNFVALPITFGLGVDYGVNVMRRVVEEERRLDPRRAVSSSIRQTGGAVILCSLTTLIGYISLYTSPNRAVNSFGVAMSLSEITCLAAAVLVLPAALVLVLTRRAPIVSAQSEAGGSSRGVTSGS